MVAGAPSSVGALSRWSGFESAYGEVRYTQPSVDGGYVTFDLSDLADARVTGAHLRYSVNSGAGLRHIRFANTAVAGLSMGGRQSCQLSLHYPDKFGYVGLFSGVTVPEGHEAAFDAVFAARPKLYWIGCGKADGIIVNSRKLKDWCDAKGYPVTLYESEGGHIWRNWRTYLTVFVPQLFK